MNGASGTTESDIQASFCSTLTAQWAALGITTAYVAPGSRSTPMVLALEAQRGIDVVVFLDERSAAFAALGHGLATGRPAVVVCTSGTAATHLHAAVVEAHLSRVPMVVVTADRPPELRDLGAPQTIDQTKMFGSSVRWFHDPGVAAESARHTWVSLAARVVHRAIGSPPGPVHLNLPFREPLLGVPTPAEDAHRPRTLHDAPRIVDDSSLAAIAALVRGRRGVVVAGRGAPAVAELDALSRALDWPVLADPRVAEHPDFVRCFDSIVRADVFERPELVIRFGEPPSSKVTAQWLASVDQIHVDRDGSWFDADHRVVLRVHGSLDDLARRLATEVDRGDDSSWRAAWLDADRRADRAIGTELEAAADPCGPGAVRHFVHALPTDTHLVVSSSMPVRDLEWFGGHLGGRVVHSNRGANGIDGVIATAIGVAVATGGPTAVLLGDVAFVHDSSSLAMLAGRRVDLRILVTDNDGGGIFHYLPQATGLDRPTFEKLFGTPHRTDLAALAAAHGLDARRVATTADVAARARIEGVTVTVVPTDRERDQAVHRRLHDAVKKAIAR